MTTTETPDLNFTWLSDRISNDMTVDDRIHNAVLAERKRLEAVWSERCMMLLTAKDSWMDRALGLVADERERCAKIAEHDASYCRGEAGHVAGVVAMGISDKIRSGQ